MFKRVLKTILALAAGHGVQTLTQLLLPPLFIASYGVKGYGEWLVLSAAVGYLGTLDFGLQTYVLNELTGLYHRQEMEQFHRVQSVGLRLMLCFVIPGVLLAGSAFLFPLATILKITRSQVETAWTVFWLALQVLAAIPLGQIFGIYRTFGQAHRGVMWGNGYRVVLLAVTVGLLILRAPFWMIAFGQVVIGLIVIAAVLISLKRSRPDVCPRLDYWDKGLAWKILKPSTFFGLFLLNNFLVYQAPVLLLQGFLGAEMVVVFSVARTLFSFVRQGSTLLQQSIAPEVTRLNGVGDKEKLIRLYVLFERVVLSGILIANTGLLLLAPTLLRFWLNRPELFNVSVFVPVMLISIVSSAKEYKIYFQCMTNNHIKTGLMTFISYLLMVFVSVPITHWFGLQGFLAVWLSVELLQIGFLHFYNVQFFGGRPEISLQLSLRLGLALVVLVAFAATAGSFLKPEGYFLQTVIAISAMTALSGLSYFLFGFRDVLHEWRKQVPGIGIRSFGPLQF